MSRKDDDQVSIALQETNRAQEKAKREWARIDAVMHSSLPLIKKMAVISHLRVANSGTGEQWAAVSTHHAHVLGVSEDHAQRIFRELRKEKVLEQVEKRTGKTHVVKLSEHWVDDAEAAYVSWKTERRKHYTKGTPSQNPGCLQTPSENPGCGPSENPGSHPVRMSGNPLIDPLNGTTEKISMAGALAAVPLSSPQHPSAAPSKTSEEEGPGRVVEAHNKYDDHGGKQGVTWVEPGQIPRDWRAPAWQDPEGGVHLVFSERGRKFWDGLMRDGYTAAQVRVALATSAERFSKFTMSSWKLPRVSENLIEQHCGYARQGEARAAGRRPAVPVGGLRFTGQAT